jgi:hypothetical protein
VKGSHSPDALSTALWGWVSPAASRAKVRSMAEVSLPLGLPGSAMPYVRDAVLHGGPAGAAGEQQIEPAESQQTIVSPVWERSLDTTCLYPPGDLVR